jgi:hypothetical protein
MAGKLFAKSNALRHKVCDIFKRGLPEEKLKEFGIMPRSYNPKKGPRAKKN